MYVFGRAVKLTLNTGYSQKYLLYLQPVCLHYVFVLNNEYSDKQLMIKITEFL